MREQQYILDQYDYISEYSNMNISIAACAAYVLLLAMWPCATDDTCRRGESMRVAARVIHNATGHWEAAVHLEQTTGPPGRKGDVMLEMEPSTAFCGAGRTDTLFLKLSGPPPPPGPGYAPEAGVGLYRFHADARTWAEAKAACEAENAHLLVIESEAEDKAIQQLLKKQANLTRWILIGFNDIATEGEYITLFGDLLSSLPYARWNPGQPDNFNGNENCGSISQSAGLNDLSCTSKTSYICEQRLL